MPARERSSSGLQGALKQVAPLVGLSAFSELCSHRVPFSQFDQAAIPISALQAMKGLAGQGAVGGTSNMKLRQEDWPG